eukprot:274472-Hanusia_phi.AAC.2
MPERRPSTVLEARGEERTSASLVPSQTGRLRLLLKLRQVGGREGGSSHRETESEAKGEAACRRGGQWDGY